MNGKPFRKGGYDDVSSVLWEVRGVYKSCAAEIWRQRFRIFGDGIFQGIEAIRE